MSRFEVTFFQFATFKCLLEKRVRHEYNNIAQTGCRMPIKRRVILTTSCSTAGARTSTSNAPQ